MKCPWVDNSPGQWSLYTWYAICLKPVCTPCTQLLHQDHYGGGQICGWEILGHLKKGVSWGWCLNCDGFLCQRVTPNLIVKLPHPGGPSTHEATLRNPNSPATTKASSPGHHHQGMALGTPGHSDTLQGGGKASSAPGTPLRPCTPRQMEAGLPPKRSLSMDMEATSGKKIKWVGRHIVCFWVDSLPMDHDDPGYGPTFLGCLIYFRVEGLLDAAGQPISQSQMLAPSVLITGVVLSKAKSLTLVGSFCVWNVKDLNSWVGSLQDNRSAH